MKKRFLAILLAVALTCATIAFPVAALSSTMTYVRDSGYFNMQDGTAVSYGCTTGASITRATGSMTVGRTCTLAASITAHFTYLGIGYSNTDNQLISGTQASVSTTHVWDKDPSVVGDIMYATSTYSVGTFLSVNQRVPQS